MKYIETEMKKRRGGAPDPNDDEEEEEGPRGMVDIYEELYRVPNTLKADEKPKPVEEGNVQLSTQMLTAIPEVDLGIE